MRSDQNPTDPAIGTRHIAMNCRDPNSLRSNAGLGCRCSTQTNKRSAIPEAASPVRNVADAMPPSAGASSNINASAADVIARRPAPSQSTLALERCWSSPLPIPHSARKSRTAQSGKLIQKIQRHPIVSAKNDPSGARDPRGTDDGAPKSKRPRAPRPLVGTSKEGRRGAGDAGTGDTLQCAECQQNVERVRARTQQRGQAKQPCTPSEHLNASVSVSKATCDRQTEDQSKAVDVDDPGRSCGSGTEVAANVG